MPSAISTDPAFKDIVERGSTTKLNDLDLTLDEFTEDEMVEQIQKIDSVHDFGGTRGNSLATDTVTKMRESDKWPCNSMMMSFIQKYSFQRSGLLNDIDMKAVSSFSYPGTGSLTRFVDDVERYCFLLSIKNQTKPVGASTRAAKFNKYFKSFARTGTFDEIYAFLADGCLDNVYPESTGKVNLIVDTPGKFTSLLREGVRDPKFAYVLTQESAHDSAKGKPTTLEPETLIKAYGENAFCETFGPGKTQVRTYKMGANQSADSNEEVFESNYSITFTGMKYVQRSRECFQTEVEYRKGSTTQSVDCTLNSLAHPTNVPMITKTIGPLMKNNNIQLTSPDREILFTNRNISDFYQSFNSQLDGRYANVDGDKIDFNFTKKRGGDGLQARICKAINNGQVKLKCWKLFIPGVSRAGSEKARLDTSVEYIIGKLVLCTIDRVLFSYCVKNGIPAIYSGTKGFLIFNPLSTAAMTGGSATSFPTRFPTRFSTHFPAHLPLLRSPPKQQPLLLKSAKPSHQDNRMVGGDHIGSTEAVKFFQNIPFYLYKILPKILLIHSRPHSTHYKSKYPDDDKLITIYNDNRYNKNAILVNQIAPVRRPSDGEGYEQYNSDPNMIISVSKSAGYPIIVKISDARGSDFVLFGAPGGGVGAGSDFIFSKAQIAGIFSDGIITRQAANTIFNDIGVFHDFEDFNNPAHSPSPVSNSRSGGKGRSRSRSRSKSTSSSTSSKRSTKSNNSNKFNKSNKPNKTKKSASNNRSKSAKSRRSSAQQKMIVPKMPVLNMYLYTFYHRPIAFRQQLLQDDNVMTMMSYLSVFDHYETLLCIDDDKYKQDFEKMEKESLEITQKIALYVFFYYLIQDFPEQRGRISYSLLEYCLLHTNQNRGYESESVYHDLQEQLYYVYCSYITRPKTVSTVIEEAIQKGDIQKENPIFVHTQRYVRQLVSRVAEKTAEINRYVSREHNERRANRELDSFMKEYLGVYGFMNMTSLFLEKASMNNNT